MMQAPTYNPIEANNAATIGGKMCLNDMPTKKAMIAVIPGNNSPRSGLIP